ETMDREVLQLRRRQAKNLMATLFLSQGVPMLTAGDEFLRTQRGNNNAWCQDNAISWVDWDLAKQNAGHLRFVRDLIALGQRHPALLRRRFFEGRGRRGDQLPDVRWHGVELGRPDFSPQSRSLALVLDGRRTGREPDQDFYAAFNAWERPLLFKV